MTAVVQVHRRVRVAPGRDVQPGRYVVPAELSAEDAQAVTAYRSWGVFVEGSVPAATDSAPPAPVPAESVAVPTLASSNAALAAYLGPYDQPDRDAFWSDYTDDQLNAFLKTRFDVDVKDRPRGTIENMIESRLGL